MNDDQLREIASRHAREAVAPIGSRGHEALQAANGLTSVILQNIRRQEEIIFYALKEAHQPHKSGTHEDTRRLRRFAEMALAVEGKDETFGSQLTADRELGFLREDFLGEHAKGADAYTAFCRAIDNLTDSAELPPKPGPSPTADEDGRCTRCGCRFEDPRELTHECPPGFQLPSERTE